MRFFYVRRACAYCASSSLSTLEKRSLTMKKSKAEGNLRFVLPKGSLGPKCRFFLGRAGYRLNDPDRSGYMGTAIGVDFFERDRRMIPSHIEKSFDAGIAGKDLVLASGIRELRVIEDLQFSRKTNLAVRWVLANSRGLMPDGSIAIGTEYPVLAQVLLSCEKTKLDYTIVELEGNEEQAIRDGLCDAILVVTETGDSIRQAGLKIIEEFDNLLVSCPQIIAKPYLSEGKERSLQMLSVALRGAVLADGRKMVTFDIRKDAIDMLSLPSEIGMSVLDIPKPPGWAAGQICITTESLPSVLLQLKEAGAVGIVISDPVGYLP